MDLTGWDQTPATVRVDWFLYPVECEYTDFIVSVWAAAQVEMESENSFLTVTTWNIHADLQTSNVSPSLFTTCNHDSSLRILLLTAIRWHCRHFSLYIYYMNNRTLLWNFFRRIANKLLPSSFTICSIFVNAIHWMCTESISVRVNHSNNEKHKKLLKMRGNNNNIKLHTNEEEEEDCMIGNLHL